MPFLAASSRCRRSSHDGVRGGILSTRARNLERPIKNRQAWSQLPAGLVRGTRCTAGFQNASATRGPTLPRRARPSPPGRTHGCGSESVLVEPSSPQMHTRRENCVDRCNRRAQVWSLKPLPTSEKRSFDGVSGKRIEFPGMRQRMQRARGHPSLAWVFPTGFCFAFEYRPSRLLVL